jgi:hypothetical protein
MEEVAKEKNTFWPKCYGWTKQIFYIFSWIIIITYIKSDDFNPGLFALFLLCITVSLVIYSISIVFLFVSSKTLKLLNNINENESIHEIMEKLFKEKPVVNIACSCYHFETRTYTSTDAQGHTTTTTTTVPVTTYIENQQLNIFSYIDISGIFRLKETNKSFIQLELGKEINFNDELTMLDAENIRNELYLKNKHRDAFITVSINRIIPSMKEYYFIKLRKNKNYFLLQKWVYILCTFLMVEQFYKAYIDYISTHQFFVIRKIVSSRQNVLENNKYSKFTPGYIIENENFVAKRDEIGGINVETKLILPTEEEIQKSKAYYKFIPQYELNEYGEVVNNNRNSIDNILNINNEKKNENEIVQITKIDSSNELLLNVNNKNNQFDNNTNQFNNNDNINNINEPMIDKK